MTNPQEFSEKLKDQDAFVYTLGRFTPVGTEAFDAIGDSDLDAVLATRKFRGFLPRTFARKGQVTLMLRQGNTFITGIDDRAGYLAGEHLEPNVPATINYKTGEVSFGFTPDRQTDGSPPATGSGNWAVASVPATSGQSQAGYDILKEIEVIAIAPRRYSRKGLRKEFGFESGFLPRQMLDDPELLLMQEIMQAPHLLNRDYIEDPGKVFVPDVAPWVLQLPHYGFDNSVYRFLGYQFGIRMPSDATLETQTEMIRQAPYWYSVKGTTESFRAVIHSLNLRVPGGGEEKDGVVPLYTTGDYDVFREPSKVPESDRIQQGGDWYKSPHINIYLEAVPGASTSPVDYARLRDELERVRPIHVVIEDVVNLFPIEDKWCHYGYTPDFSEDPVPDGYTAAKQWHPPTTTTALAYDYDPTFDTSLPESASNNPYGETRQPNCSQPIGDKVSTGNIELRHIEHWFNCRMYRALPNPAYPENSDQKWLTHSKHYPNRSPELSPVPKRIGCVWPNFVNFEVGFKDHLKRPLKRGGEAAVFKRDGNNLHGMTRDPSPGPASSPGDDNETRDFRFSRDPDHQTTIYDAHLPSVTLNPTDLVGPSKWKRSPIPFEQFYHRGKPSHQPGGRDIYHTQHGHFRNNSSGSRYAKRDGSQPLTRSSKIDKVDIRFKRGAGTGHRRPPYNRRSQLPMSWFVVDLGLSMVLDPHIPNQFLDGSTLRIKNRAKETFTPAELPEQPSVVSEEDGLGGLYTDDIRFLFKGPGNHLTLPGTFLENGFTTGVSFGGWFRATDDLTENRLMTWGSGTDTPMTLSFERLNKVTLTTLLRFGLKSVTLDIPSDALESPNWTLISVYYEPGDTRIWLRAQVFDDTGNGVADKREAIRLSRFDYLRLPADRSVYVGSTSGQDSSLECALVYTHNAALTYADFSVLAARTSEDVRNNRWAGGKVENSPRDGIVPPFHTNLLPMPPNRSGSVIRDRAKIGYPDTVEIYEIDRGGQDAFGISGSGNSGFG